MACRLCIITAHQALQLGKLTDHGRLQIGLADARGLGGQIGLGPDHGGDFAGQSLDPLHTIRLRAKLVMEGHAGKALAHAFQPFGFHAAQIVFPKEFRV